MSVAEYKWLGDKKPVARPRSVDSEGADARRPSHDRDMLSRIRTRDICSVARQLATLLRAGMPLVPALTAFLQRDLNRRPCLVHALAGAVCHHLRRP